MSPRPPTGDNTPSDAEDDDDDSNAATRKMQRSTVQAVAVTEPSPTTQPLDSGVWDHGTILGDRYQLLGLLGQGGMGEVFAAQDLRNPGTTVAIKRVVTADARSLVYLKREYRRMEGLVHPNLVRLLGLAEHRGRPFIVMERVDGRELYDAIGPPEHLDFDHLRQIIRGITDGVLYLHEHGRVHRDLKGSNILVTATNLPVILDFGLVNELQRRTLLTSTLGRVEGTALYMSPEQAAGHLATPASDWYAIGVALFRCVTGQYPLVGNPYQLIMAKQSQVPVLARQLAPRVPRDLEVLIARLLQREPGLRATALDLLTWCDSTAARLNRPAPPPQQERWVGRERELGLLRQAQLRFLDRTPLRVDITGPSGCGKTALLTRFLADLSQQSNVLVFSSRCHEYDTVTYKAFDGLVDQIGSYLARLPMHEVKSLLGESGPVLALLFPTLRQVRGLLPSTLDLGDPKTVRAQAFLALRQFLYRLALRCHLVLAVDDLQWGDVDSAQLLDAVLAPPGAPPLLFACAYRSEDLRSAPILCELTRLQARSSQRDMNLVVEVEPLPHAEATTLAGQLLGSDHQLARASAIASEAHGNPMLITAIVQYLGSAEALDQPIRFTLARRRLSVGQLAARHLQQLTPAARSLLAAIAVAGQPSQLSVLAAATGIVGDPQPALATLRAASLVRTTRVGEDDILEVYHPEIGRAVRETLAPGQATQLHRNIATALTDSDAEPERLALHWQAAGELVRAGTAAIEAADLAMRAGAFARACTLLRMAHDCLPDSAEVQRKLAAALVAAGQPLAAAPILLSLAESSRKPAVARRLRREAGEYLMVSGQVDAGLTVLLPLLDELSLTYPDDTFAAQARFKAAVRELQARGNTWIERSAMQLSSYDLERYDLCWTLCKGHILDDFARGGLFGLESLLLALDLGEPRRLVRSLALAGAVVLERGFNDGRAWLVEAETLAERIGDQPGLGFVQVCRGLMLRGTGAFGQALANLEAGLRLLPCDCTWEHDLASASLLGSLEALGELPMLAVRSDQLRRVANDQGSRRIACLAHIYSASVALAADDVAGCQAHLAEAEALIADRPVQILHLHALRVAVDCDLYAGKPAAAWRRIELLWPALERSDVFNIRLRRTIAAHIRARAGIALDHAQDFRSPTLADIIDQDLRVLRHERNHHTRPQWHLLSAGINPSRRIATPEFHLEAAANGFDRAGMALHATATRWRLAGRRLPGAASEHERCADLLRLRGVIDLARWVAVHMPGV